MEPTIEQSAEQHITPETNSIQKSDVTLIFGQGPVQEYTEGQNKEGRTGLNFFSRLNALAGAEMLIEGKTDTVIVSGGATGALKEATEADLMAKAISKRIRQHARKTPDGSIELTLGENTITIPAMTTDGTPLSQEEVQQKLDEFIQSKVKIENQSQDTIENFVNVINQYIDADPSSQSKRMTLLGIGYHAEDTYSGAGIGRLEKLAEIYDIKGQVLSAEKVLQELVINKKSHDSNFVASELTKLTEQARNHEVAQLKSEQERVLVELLDVGEWLPKAHLITNPDRLRNMLSQNNFTKPLIPNSLEDMSLEELQQLCRDLTVQIKTNPRWLELHTHYDEVKGGVLHQFEQLRNKRIRSILKNPSLTDIEIDQYLSEIRIRAASLRNDLKEMNKQIEAAHAEKLPTNQITNLITQRARILGELDPLHTLLTEDKYSSDKTYMMLYGKGEDPRTKNQ